MRTVSAIDIGTDKIVALIGEVDSYGDVHVVGVGEAKSRGIDRGSVTKLEVAARAIATAVREAEEMSGQKVADLIINISGSSVKSQNEKGSIPISSSPVEVEREHINRLMERSTSRGKEEGYEIIHAIPRKYTLDDQEGIEDPIGLVGSRLSAQVHIIKVGTTLNMNLDKAVSSAGFNPSGKVVNALASAKATLTEEEKEEGVLLVDIGAGLTDYVLYIEGNPVVTGCVPLGGRSITKDISYFMRVDHEEAERIKKESGIALVDLVKEGEVIKVKPRGEEREVSVESHRLAEVIQVRLEEIFEKVVESIEEQGYSVDSANAGVVVTGGSANLKGVKEFVERFTDLPARIGLPTGVIGLKEKIEDTRYSTAVGLLQYASATKSAAISSSPNGRSPSNRTLQSVWERIKEFFREVI